MIISISGKIGSGKDTAGQIVQYLYWRNSFKNDITAKNFPPISEAHFDLYRNSLVIERSSLTIVKWADKLKDMVSILLGCTREQLEDRVFKETELGEEWWYYKFGDSIYLDYLSHKGNTIENGIDKNEKYIIKPTPRLLMQLLGTECGRNILHTNVWVNATMIDYKPIGDYPIIKGDSYVEDVYIYPNWIITDTRFPNEADAVKSKGGINIRLIRANHKGIKDDFENSNINLHPSETALDNYQFDYIIDNNGTIEDLIIKVKEILIKENII